MSRPSALGTICYAAESSWGEDVTTFGTRLAIANQVDASGLEQSRIPTNRTVQMLNGGTFEAVGMMGGSFRTRFFLAGHGSTTSGATSATSLPTLLGYVFGGGPGSPAAGSTFTGGTATAPTTTASATFTAGQLCRGRISVGLREPPGGLAQPAVAEDRNGAEQNQQHQNRWQQDLQTVAGVGAK